MSEYDIPTALYIHLNDDIPASEVKLIIQILEQFSGIRQINQHYDVEDSHDQRA